MYTASLNYSAIITLSGAGGKGRDIAAAGKSGYNTSGYIVDLKVQ